jgi:hypothetical protein
MTRTWFQEQLASKIGIGVEQERERIIELLENNDHYSVDWLIALIKGETK